MDPTLAGSGLPDFDLDGRFVPDGIPDRIGAYRVVRVLGEGGMGTVYEAEQEKPRRLVALKVLKPGVATPELLKRFERESQVLGLLQHPGIAQIYEAGTAPSAAGPQPYFAMELVNGRRLDDFARDRRLGVRQRLELVARVCDAVQHAHQKGIVHRDLKPGNVVVVPEEDSTSSAGTSSPSDTRARERDVARVGQPKVLDFGIARVTDADLQAATIQTEVGQILGTVRYMSPEQIAGDSGRIDARTDIYSLGVVLFELLAGRMPYEIDGKTILEAMRAIRDDEPVHLASVQRSLRGDVDTIVAKAIEKEKDRRYATAGEMAADIRRFLRDEPIVARPPSTTYQIRKFAARNRVLVAGVVATFLALVAGIVATAWQAYSAVQARDDARRAASEAKAFSDFLVQDMLLSADPQKAKGRDITVEDVLENAAARVDAAFEGQPLVAASVRATLGRVFYSLGRSEDAEPHLRFALDVQRRMLGEGHEDTLKSMHWLGRVLLALSRLEEAEAILREELAIRGRLGGQAAVDLATTTLAQVLVAKGDSEGAEAAYVRVLEALERIGRMSTKESAVFVSASADLANLYGRRGDRDRALSLYDEALEALRVSEGDLHPDVARVIGNKANLLGEMGRTKEACAELERALEIQHAVFRDDHPDIATTRTNLAYYRALLGDLPEAESHARAALELRTVLLGADAPETAVARGRLGGILRQLDRRDDAEPEVRRALADLQRGLGPDADEVSEVQFELALLLRARKDDEGAIAACEDCLRIRRLREEAYPSRVVTALSLLAQLRHAQGNLELAEEAYRDVVERYRKLDGDRAHNTAIAHANLGMVLGDEGRLAEGEAELALAVELTRGLFEADSPNVGFLLTPNARLLRKLGRLDEASALIEESLSILEKRMPPGHSSAVSAALALGEVRLAQGRAAEAEAILAGVVEARRKQYPEGDWQRAIAEGAFGRCLVALERYDEAEPMLEGAYAPLTSLKRDPSMARDVAGALADLYEARQAGEKASEWRARAAPAPR